MRNCCYECTKRKIGCHGTCEEYKAWKTKNKASTSYIKTKQYFDYFLGEKGPMKRKVEDRRKR